MKRKKGGSRLSDNKTWLKMANADYARGIRKTTTPEKAQAHVQELVSRYGVSVRGIATAADIAPFIISNLNRGICTGLHVDSERAILAVTVESVFQSQASTAYVPSIGAQRRVQALMAIGWRHRDLIERLGFDTPSLLYKTGEWVTRRRHDAVKDLYDQLWDQPGPCSIHTQRRIAKAGYAPPLAWDDDTIDDPKAVPDLGAVVRGRGRPTEGQVLASDAQLEDVEFLVEQALTWDAITERLGVEPGTLERMLLRKGRADLVSRAKNMTERLAYARAS